MGTTPSGNTGQAIISSDTLLKYRIAENMQDIFIEIPLITDIDFPPITRTMHDITDLNSVAKEKLPDIPDGGQPTLSINYDPLNDVHMNLYELFISATKLEFVTDIGGDGYGYAYYAYLQGFVTPASIETVIKQTITLDITGGVALVNNITNNSYIITSGQIGG